MHGIWDSHFGTEKQYDAAISCFQKIQFGDTIYCRPCLTYIRDFKGVVIAFRCRKARLSNSGGLFIDVPILGCYGEFNNDDEDHIWFGRSLDDLFDWPYDIWPLLNKQPKFDYFLRIRSFTLIPTKIIKAGYNKQ